MEQCQNSSQENQTIQQSSVRILEKLHQEFEDIDKLTKQEVTKRIEQKIIRDLDILHFTISKKNTEISRWIYK